MDAPVFTATVQNVTRGWTYTVTHGVPAPEGATTVLVDPLTVSGAFDDEMIPNQLEPHVATINLWSTTSKVRPLVRRGDVVLILLRLGGPFGAVLFSMPMQVSEVTTELAPGQRFAYRAKVTATDLSVSLGSYFPGPRTPATNAGVTGLGNRIAWVGAAGGYSVGVPAGFVASIDVGTGVGWLRDKSAREQFRLMLNTLVPPGGKHHAVTPYGSGPVYPAGYAYPGATIGGPGGNAPPDPGSWLQWMVQPASRNLDYNPGLPLRFAKVGGRLELAAPPTTHANRMPAAPARACTIPASGRQGREHAPNAVRLVGKATNINGTPTDPANLESESTLDVTLPDAIATGYRGREVEVLTPLRSYADDPATAGAAYPQAVALAESYLADASTLARDWTFDDIIVNANELTAAEAASLLPVLVPAFLDGGRDGRLIRHLTIHSIDPDVRLDADVSTIDGFVVAWRIEIAGGQLTYAITTTPGRPSTPTAAPAPMTVGQLRTSPVVAGLTTRDVHPNPTIADLAMVSP